MIHYGMPALIEMPKINDCAKLCSELGLRFVEFNMNLPEYQTDKINVDDIKAAMEKYGIYCTIHLDEIFNPFDLNSTISNAYIDIFSKTADIAKEIGAPSINMHMLKGIYFTMPNGKIYLYDTYREDYLARVNAFSDIVSSTLSGTDITLCIENCNGYMDFHKEAIEILLKNPHIALTFDIGHSHAAGGVDEPFILEHKDKLRHFHIHDAIGSKNHKTLGTGEIDLPKYISLAKETNSRAVLETKTVEALKKSVVYLKNNLDSKT